ncbi:MAG: protein kinase, partial [Myxococcales bacterium]|nr:protein kinase [Myxococcales bacterium]
MSRGSLNPFSRSGEGADPSSAVSATSWRPGELIAGRFRLERMVGEGGMGFVFRARDTESGQAVAVKILRGSSIREIERFDREARVLGELDHPGIVRYVAHGIGEEPRHHRYLAMEWLEGETLRERLERVQRLSVREMLVVALRVSAALAGAHGRGLVHRDLKPDNLFIRNGDLDQLTLLDFGIVRTPSALDRVTNTGVALGSPGYMSPEQVRGERTIRPCSDIFSLGCVLYRCVCGEPPFTGPSSVAILMKTMLREPTRPGELIDTLPPAVDALLCEMLQKAEAARPQDGAALLERLASLERALESTSPGSIRLSGLTRREQRVASVLLTSLAPPAVAVNKAAEAQIAADAERRLAQARAIVEPFCGRVVDWLEGGMAVVFSGDELPAIQALRAARCAFALRRVVGESPIAIATDWGELEVSAPLGAVIDRLSQMAIIARSGEVTLDEATARLLRSRFKVEADGDVFRLGGERESNESKTPVDGVGPIVGRERELGVLFAALQQTRSVAAHRRLFVCGESGSGSTRLLREFTRALVGDHVLQAIAVRSDPSDRENPFALCAKVIRTVAGFQRELAPAAQRERLRRGIADLLPGPAIGRVITFLCELANIPLPGISAEVAAARSDPRLMRTQMQAAWRVWVWALSQVGPLIWVVDDLQWADRASLHFVADLQQSLPQTALLLVGAISPDVEPTIREIFGEASETIWLTPLADEASELIVRMRAGNRLKMNVVREIVRRAEGNVYFLEELTRAQLQNQRGELPKSVLGVVQARFGRLDANLRRTLRAASILGSAFGAEDVAVLLGGVADGSDVFSDLRALQEHGILMIDALGGGEGHERFRFASELVRETAYSTLTAADRQLGHRLAAEHLERLGEAGPAELARHLLKAKLPKVAALQFARAAKVAFEANQFDQAIELARRAASLGIEGRDRVGALMVSAFALRYGRRYAESQRAFAALRTALEPGSADWYETLRGELVAAQYAGDRLATNAAIDLLQSVPVDPQRVSGPQIRAFLTAATFIHQSGDTERGRAFHDQAELLGEHLSDDEPLALAHLERAKCYWLMLDRELEASMKASQEAVS